VKKGSFQGSVVRGQLSGVSDFGGQRLVIGEKGVGMPTKAGECLSLVLVAAVLSLAVACFAQGAESKAAAVQTFALTDTGSIADQNVKTEAVEYLGRKCVRVNGLPDKDGFALLKDVDFHD